MRVKKTILVFLISIFATAQLTIAAPTTAQQAKKVVKGWLRQTQNKPLDVPLGQAIQKVDTFADPNVAPTYYIVYIEPSGFVIVPADDDVEPIIGFSPNGEYNPSLDNPLGALVTRDMAGRVQHVRKASSKQNKGLNLSKEKRKWSDLESIADEDVLPPGANIQLPADVRVSPLVQSVWDQSTECGANCYNIYTPENYVCGCVATAMAQLMRFYQLPAAPNGTGPFQIWVNGNSQDNFLRGGDGNGGNYAWNNMVLDPDCAITQIQRQAIAALTYDAGVASHMQYDTTVAGGSGAWMDDAQDALLNVFSYSNVIHGGAFHSNSNIGDGLSAMVNPNLDAGYPVLFAIHRTGGGHAIVCDGYGYDSSVLYHHLNMGWGESNGAQNVWYDLPNINSSPFAYTTISVCLYNIYTTGSNEIISGRVTDESGNPVSGATVTATRTGGGTYTTSTNSRGVYALAKIPSNSSYTIAATKSGYTFSNRNANTAISSDFSTTSGNIWAVDFTPGSTPINHPPVLSNPQVSPTSGTENTNFTYTIHYYDADGDAPIMGKARVYIDGQPELMVRENGSPADGDYTFTDQLGLGYHNYSFAFINENGFDTTSTYYNVPYVHTEGCGIELKVEVSGGPVTNNIEIKFDYGAESQQWYAPELPQNVWIDSGQQLGFSVYLESNNHTCTKWESRDDDGNLVSESLGCNDSFTLGSGNIHATAFLSYTPVNYTISGTVHRDSGSAVPGGVDLTLTSSQQTLHQHIDSTSFSFTGVKGGVPVSITYEASDGGYAFSPPSVSWGNLKSDHTGEDITGFSSDTTSPMTSFVMIPPAVSEDSSVTFSWIGEDDVTVPANLMYQYKLDGVDADWSLWTLGTSILYDNLENGEYTFWVRAKDEAENINQAPTNYTFVVNAAPKVVSAERINRSVWASRLTLEMPVGASNPTDSFVLLPEHSGMSDTELAPVSIHRVDEAIPCGASEIVASELGITSAIVKSESGWLVTLPESVPSGQTVQYDIVWGKIKYFGWQDFVSVPAGFPNGGSVQFAYLDDSLRTWRCAGKWEQHGSGVADDEGWIYMDSCNRNGIIIPETTMRYVRGESWGGDAGTRTKFENGRIFKSGSNMCVIWQDERYEYDGSPPDINKRRYGLQIFDNAGNTLNSVDGTYYDRAAFYFPSGLIHGDIWIVASQSIGSQWDDPDDAWFLVLNENGTEIKSKTVFDTFQNSNGSSLSTERAYGLGNNILLLWTKEWGTAESDGRSKIVYEVWNTSGTIVKDETNLSPEPLPDSIEEDDEYWVENILSDKEGKVWISYSHDRSGQADEYYYIIISSDGNVWKGPIQTTGERMFNYCDKDGYIWATENGQFFALNPDDTVAIPARTSGWIPNQEVGLIAASAGASGYRLYDRWSPQTIQIDIPSGTNADSMMLFDMNLWDNNLHPANINLKKDTSTIWSHSGQFTGHTDVDVSGTLDEGLNILLMTQEDFLGGQVLITFPYTLPNIDGDFNNDRIVNLSDLEILATQWLGTPGDPSADIVRDHVIDFLDFAGFAENWGVDNRVSQKIVDYTLDSNPGWTYQGQWAFGQPSGSGGSNGNPDPISGYTGNNVYGVNLAGDYTTTAGGPYYLTSEAIDCTGYSNVHLKFARWLNTDFPPYASSKVEVSSNGTTWQTVWEHTGSRDITDDAWQQMDYDISSFADNQPTIYLRWSYEMGGGAYPYSGWNIDDIQLWGIR